MSVTVKDTADVDRIHREVVRRVRYTSFSRSYIDLSATCRLANGMVRRNKPLNRSMQNLKWKSDILITENQLRRKREEYWDTGTYPTSLIIEGTIARF